MEKLYAVLNKQVANLSIFFTKLHHYHWYVEGPHFYRLHEKFEELYDEINELYDEFAERLLMIGGKPLSTQKAYLEVTSLAEAAGVEDADVMVGHVLKDIEIMAIELKEALVIAQDLGDEVTVDLLITTLASFEKHIWMLSATLK
ncbi:MAG: DNA starvation/stationary phase protection protein [Acholeplasmataceae bacterium]|nr:DNA starvation/stationary phase protection protein [Acholeplasmataceae bacterium]